METCHRAFWIQGHRTEQSTHCGDLSQSNHEPVIKSKRESRRHSHRDFIPTLRKSQSAGFRVEIMSRFLDWMQNDWSTCFRIQFVLNMCEFEMISIFLAKIFVITAYLANLLSRDNCKRKTFQSSLYCLGNVESDSVLKPLMIMDSLDPFTRGSSEPAPCSSFSSPK